jgi:hypothetical protein
MLVFEFNFISPCLLFSLMTIASLPLLLILSLFFEGTITSMSRSTIKFFNSFSRALRPVTFNWMILRSILRVSFVSGSGQGVLVC